MTSNRLLPTPREMIAHLDRFVRGQTRAKQDLAVAVYNHYLSQAHRDETSEDLGRFHVLLLGPTGSGKTYMVRKLAEQLGVPVSFASATALVQAGYRGRPVDDIVKSLLDRAKDNPRLAERGIIFIDEIDKVRRNDGIGPDVNGEGVQNALLTLLDGKIAEEVDSRSHEPIDTSRILFVCTGAFVGLDDLVRQRVGAAGARIGFHARPQEDLDAIPDKPIYEMLCQATTGDLVRFGLIPEFVGRFSTITALHELGFGDLRAILGETIQSSALQRQQKLARLHGIELEITADALDMIARDAERLGTGARGLARLVGVAVDSVDHRWPELAEQGVTRVVVDASCLLGKSEPRLERTKSKAKSGAASTGVGSSVDSEPAANRLRSLCMNSLPPPPSDSGTGTRPRLPEGITDTTGWSSEEILSRLAAVKKTLDWDNTSGSARKWWVTFEQENTHRVALVFRLAEELAVRKATITEFFLAYAYSNTDNIQANLHYLDYTRIKKSEEAKKRKPASES